MQARLKAAFKTELDKGKELLASGAYEQAFYHLERAHIRKRPAASPLFHY